jgi:hypothetical protein
VFIRKVVTAGAATNADSPHTRLNVLVFIELRLRFKVEVHYSAGGKLFTEIPYFWSNTGGLFRKFCHRML